MLELGSGFNPEFTGRENAFLNASLLGLSRQQTHLKFSEIAAFADIGDFLDQPVKTYSTGMMMRLAFAVQTAVEPDILIVDEALAVGDAGGFLQRNALHVWRVCASAEQRYFSSPRYRYCRAVCNYTIVFSEGARLPFQGDAAANNEGCHRLLFEADDHYDERKTMYLLQSWWMSRERVGTARAVPGANSVEPPESSLARVNIRSLKVEIVNVRLRDRAEYETRVVDVHQEVVFPLTARYNEIVPEELPTALLFRIQRASNSTAPSGACWPITPRGRPGNAVQSVC